MKRCQSGVLALIAAMTIATPVLQAQPAPTSRPFMPGRGGPEGHFPPPQVNFSPEEANEAIEFFHQNSPNRMSLFDRLPGDSRPRITITNALVRDYKPIKNFKSTHPELYDLLVQQVKLRDEAFKLARDKNTDALKSKVNELVAVSLKTRKLRLEYLQTELTHQQEQLAADESDPSKLEAAYQTKITDDTQKWINRSDRMGGRRSQADEDPFTDPLADAALINAADDVPAN